MELNREQIIKALECCAVWGDCQECHYAGVPYKSRTDCCTYNSTRDALALIKELTEEAQTYKRHHDIMDCECARLEKMNDDLTKENERLRNKITCQVIIPDEKMEEIKNECLSRVELDIKAIQTDTVRKMQERLKAKVNADLDRCYALGLSVAGPFSLFIDEIDQIAKEMLEGESNG